MIIEMKMISIKMIMKNSAVMMMPTIMTTIHTKMIMIPIKMSMMNTITTMKIHMMITMTLMIHNLRSVIIHVVV